MLFIAAPALAFDPFEIQVYDGTSDEAGHAGVELHLNRHHDTTHATLEPSFGITNFWEIGGYFQTAQGHYEGVKLRTKLTKAVSDFRLGMNFEIALEPGGHWGGEIRPILCFENARFLIAANPNISFPAAFEPGVMAKVKVGHLAVGAEYYGTFPDGENYLLGAVDLVGVEALELNLGVGGGTAPVAKLILGYVF
jgi:hypothetical protein